MCTIILKVKSTLKEKFRTHVIKLDIAPKSYPPGQYLLVSASNNMLYYLSQ
jgi:NAD(P)H-flavin reductase